MTMTRTTLLLIASATCLIASARSADAQRLTPKQRAESVFAAAGVKGGLIVHLGCGDGRLTAALRRDQAYRVHGLDADEQAIRQARKFIQSSGLYGTVSAEHWDRAYLPYADNLVNLLIAEELGQIPMREVMRVLVPGGVAYVKHGNTWQRDVKPCPQDTDEWTHYLHDASGNAVAHDQVVGPPRYIQWVAEPRHTRSHEHTPSINALVSANGRIFYIADEAPIGSVRQPARWYLVARDAYNGILLWKRPVATWFPHLINWGQAPRQLQRRLVAIGDRIYVTLGLHAPLSALDAATGDVVKVYEKTNGTEEVVCHKGTLLLAIRRATDERVAELTEFARLAVKQGSPLHARETAQPLVNRFRATESRADKSVLAFDADTGRLLWEKNGANAAALRALSLCASGDCAFYQNGKSIICLDLRTGKEQWSAPAGPLRFVCDGGVFCAGGKIIAALSAETGQTRWTQTPLLTDIRDLFVANGSLWVGGFKPFPKRRGPSWGPYFATQRDLATGNVMMHIEAENPGHHHRCYANKATDRFILAGRRGTEFIDLESGEVREHSWARGVCKYGVMPCNGLLYTPPHACACYVGTKLTGFSALASESSARGIPQELPPEDRLHRGGAYRDQYERPKIGAGNDGQWPTYRCDAARSGSTKASVPAELRLAWQQDLCKRLSSIVAAEGKVFVASIDTHTVHALDAEVGRPLWSYTACGRVDSPPTIFGDRALFGCRDGYVYCLRTSDGALAWRFDGVHAGRRILACGQLESASPVHGSVLVQDDVACFTMGRSSYIDGGIDLYRLDPGTGKMLSRTQVYSPDPNTGKQPPQSAPYAMPGVRSDILSGDGNHIYLRDIVFDNLGTEQSQESPHLFTLTDFLDDSWTHRSYWIYGTRCSISTGCSRQTKGLIYGRLLVFDESTICGYGRRTVHWSNQLQDGAYRLFGVTRAEGAVQWQKPVRIRVRAMVLADKVLFVAGPPIDPGNRPGAPDEAQGAMLLAVAASDGTTLAQYRLKAPPVFDGMAAVKNRLYMALENGSIICMEGVRSTAALQANVIR